jgi:MYXO-CTERM domain-containing protein
MRFASTHLLLAALAFAGGSAPRLAAACGGTFCDGRPQPNGQPPMPVDQTGENILFVMEPGMVEAHIQIQYKGQPEKFSWILPVQALPEVEVGSQALFDRLLAATVPTFTVNNQFDTCGQGAIGVTGAGSATGSTTGGSGGSGGVGPVQPPVVVFQKPVGAFEVTVLMSKSTAEVVRWLADNQYQMPANAPALFDAYVAKNYFFVAVKLTGGAMIDEIHPLVVRFPGTQPCVPLKLTAVAAVEDMGVRTFFLGNNRVVPKNYKHVVPNLAKLDWFNAATSYANYIGRAVDSPLANGKAFVTEYAGPTAIVGAAPIASSSWNAAPFSTAAAVTVVQLLQNQGLMQCFTDNCNYNHPLLLPLLRQYLPAPATLTTMSGTVLTDPTLIEGAFYGCQGCYQSRIDQTKWNGPMFSADLASRIIDPAHHADALLSSWNYLTRLFTTISPAEMTDDPEFMERADLPIMRTIYNVATQRITCNNTAGVTLLDGRQVALPGQNAWPLFSNDMPSAERVEEIPATGPTIVLADYSAKIDEQLKAWNDAEGWPPPNPTGAGSVTAGGTAGANGAVQADNSSCGCRTVGRPSSAQFPLALLGLAGLLVGRRRRRSVA